MLADLFKLDKSLYDDMIAAYGTVNTLTLESEKGINKARTSIVMNDASAALTEPFVAKTLSAKRKMYRASSSPAYALSQNFVSSLYAEMNSGAQTTSESWVTLRLLMEIV
jgi:hypothetical protein